MVGAVNAAKEVATKKAISPTGGWIRLARMASFTNDKQRYIIAGRLLGENGSHAEIGCSCPDWTFRKRGTREICKHQKMFLEHVRGTTPTKGIWMFKSGIAFQKAMEPSKTSENNG